MCRLRFPTQFLLVLLAAAACCHCSFTAASGAGGAADQPAGPGKVLAPFLDTSLSEWQRLEAAGDIQLEPETGSYRIYWMSPDGTRKSWTFEPAGKVKVKVEAQVARDASGAYVYRYTVYNLDSSPQNLKWFGVRYDAAEIYDIVQPDSLWSFFPHVSMLDAPEPAAFWAARLWADATDADVPGPPPGRSVSGFGFTSWQPPGVVICYARGYVRAPFLGPDAEMVTDPRPNMLGDCAVGTTVGPVPQRVASGRDGQIGLRRIAEAAGWSVAWKAKEKAVLARKGAMTLHLRVGSRVVVLNEEPIKLSHPTTIADGRTLVAAELVNQLFRPLVARLSR
jgi:hypothetical protein